MKCRTFAAAVLPLVICSLSYAQKVMPNDSGQPRTAREVLEQAKRDYGTRGLRRVFDFSQEGIPIKNPRAARSLSRNDLNALSSLLDAANQAKGLEPTAVTTCGVYALCSRFNGDESRMNTHQSSGLSRSSSNESTSSADDDKKKREDKERQEKADRERAEQLKREIDANVLSRTKTSDGETMGKKLKDNIDDLNAIP
ncbi:hypothetical protein WK13_07285 [Burkholderia ubonensis]|nr:hypothetical protein WK13_07285 [Burkholderia ubonensis]